MPETDAQAEYLRAWLGRDANSRATSRHGAIAGGRLAQPELRGAWYGLALGDALGQRHARSQRDSAAARAWTQQRR